MIAYLLYTASLFINGYLLLRLLTPRLSGWLTLLSAWPLGFGLSCFYVYAFNLLGAIPGPFLPFLTHITVIITCLILCLKKQRLTWDTPFFQQLPWPLLGVLLLAAIPLGIHHIVYPQGGWDAWSCWNLKTKFIYLGNTHWRDMFDPLLWRSNTHYPLLWPCANVYAWYWTAGDFPWAGGFNSLVITAHIALLLGCGIWHMTQQKLLACALPAIFLFIPLHLLLAISQYSDNIFGLYALLTFIAFQHSKRNPNSIGDFILMGIWLGFLSFTKVEGTAASGLLGLSLCFALWQNRQTRNIFALAAGAVMSLWPTITFMLWMAPANEAFYNGLTDPNHPLTLLRLILLAKATLIEILSLKWLFLWVWVVAVVVWFRKTLFAKPLVEFVLFFAGYFGILYGFYITNTFFEIDWWVNTTLHRILFALMPSLFLWIALGVGTNIETKKPRA